MQFKRTDELKTGMRLARPIYNKNGVLLYERDSRLTHQGINSIKNFGLIGIFILEPAEPVPPMSKEDIEFERFQTMSVFAIREEMERITANGKTGKLQIIVSNIIKNYGHLQKKINFIQNLRSREDYMYKHALNTAILCAILGNKLNLKVEDRLDVVAAALLHDLRSNEMIEKVCSENPNIKRFCIQADMIEEWVENNKADRSVKVSEGARILAVSRIFDEMTAMKLEEPPVSEVAAIQYLTERTEFYGSRVVDALIDSVNILVPGVCVELNNGEKALVLEENKQDFMRPLILSFADNSIIDLKNEFLYGDLHIMDIMKTMDNRHIIDTETLRKYGFIVSEPDDEA